MSDPSTGRRTIFIPILVGIVSGVLGMILLGVLGPLFGFDVPWRAGLGYALSWLAGFLLAYGLQRRSGGNPA